MMLRTIFCLFALASVAAGDTVRTKDGQRLEGELLEEGPTEVVLRTRYGALVIPVAAIERIERGATAPAELDVAALRALRLKARRQAQTGRREAALATYAELLALDADDVTAHVESCALRAQLGQPAEAVQALRRAVLAGFTDLEGLARDPRLATLKDDPALRELLAQRAGLLRLAARKAPARVVRALRAKGATATYRDVARDAQRLVLVHALDDAALASVAAELEAFMALARRDLFRAAPDGPLVVALVADEDRAVLGDATATFDATTSTLLLAPFPFGTLARAPAARRELARALHAVDQQARRVRHPAWLEAGLVEHLGATPGAIAAVDTQALALVADRATLERRGRAARVAAGSLVRFLAATDALAGVYEAAAITSETEAAWRASVAGERATAAPFTGLVTTATPRGLRVTYVQPESGAARSGLVEADLVVAIDGLRVRTDDELQDALRGRATGDEVEVTVLRDDLPRRATVALTARPPGPIGPSREAAPYLGVAVEQAATGVTIKSVDEGSPAAKADLRVGDLIVSLDGHEVATVRAWLRALRQKTAGETGGLVVERAGARVTIEVALVPL
jgi:type II secretory pathway component PulC